MAVHMSGEHQALSQYLSQGVSLENPTSPPIRPVLVTQERIEIYQQASADEKIIRQIRYHRDLLGVTNERLKDSVQSGCEIWMFRERFVGIRQAFTMNSSVNPPTRLKRSNCTLCSLRAQT